MKYMIDWIKDNREISYFLAGLTLFRFIYYLFIPITPQEAYYWYYSLYPDLSYFDHPPMVAYSIWLGTNIFGKSIFGVKFMAAIWSLMTNVLLYRTTLICMQGAKGQEAKGNRAKKTAFLVVILYNLSIFAHLYALIMVPDTPLLFFWLLVIFFIFKYLNDEQIKYIYFAGLALGLGLISKYTAIAILPSIFLIFLLDGKHRKILLKPHPYLAVILAAIIFSVIIYWNMMHDWASLKFQFTDRSSGLKTFQTKYLFQLIASQIFILTPLLMVLFFASGIKILKQWRSLITERNLMLTGVFIVFGFIFISLRSLVKMNWLLPGYLGFIIATVLVYQKRDLLKSVWMKIGIVFSLILLILSHLILIIPNMPLGEGNTWSGWQDSAQKISTIQQQMGGEKNTFIFTNSYKSSALLKFYLPVDQEVYAQNIFGEPALQFDIWGIPDSLSGKNALFVCTDRYEYGKNLELVKPYFDDIEELKRFHYYFNGEKRIRTIYCYLARGYVGRN
jgi:4-amino-4-deoxy-L-arabinose transferase-like glycosyltransferase